MASSSSNEDSYIFQRDYHSMARLNYNHWLHVQLTGYLLHPSILFGHSSLRIADLGTGTAIVPLCLSGQLPTTFMIDGFDISSAQFPPQGWLPENVYLYEQNIFEPFAAEQLGKYDIVHLRFLSTLIDSHNLRPLIRNVKALLKPGGYLQWNEPNMSSARSTSTSPTASTTAADQLSQLMRKPKPDAETGWIPNLSDIIAHEGLEVIVDDHVPIPNQYRMLFNVTHLLALEDVVTTKAPNTAEFTGMNEILKSLKVEFMENGVSIDQEFICVVARQPTL